jgi:hypothetical protein
MAIFSKLLGAGARDVAASNAAAAKQQRRHNGVEVIPRQGACCKAVRAISGQRFLSAEAPRLPLADCDQPTCRCRYQHFTDRRTDARRDGDVGIGIASDLYNAECRRSAARKRRSADRQR